MASVEGQSHSQCCTYSPDKSCGACTSWSTGSFCTKDEAGCTNCGGLWCPNTPPPTPAPPPPPTPPPGPTPPPTPAPPTPATPPPTPLSGPSVGGYILMERQGADGKPIGLKAMAALAANASNIPINRLWVSFFSPDMVYKSGSHTIKNTGLHISDAADGGYAELKKYVGMLEAGGVEVFLSLGGWNYNCWPYMYTKYSVAGYGTSTPNYWKIQQFGKGNVANCVESNMWCYTCEPPSEHTTLKNFVIFPEPGNSATYQAAMAYVKAHAGSVAPEFHTDIIPGKSYTDKKSGTALIVPGSSASSDAGRDPYADIVTLAKDMGCSGIDLDYEEFWHADYFGTGKGPWDLSQTAYKYAAIAKDIELNIQSQYPTCKLSTAASAVGAWGGKWWGGNMKGVWLKAFTATPDIINFMATGANAGGINVMTYDLSSNEQFHECPEPGKCALDVQVDYYMSTYIAAGIAANVGYEVGQPAYPDAKHDPSHQLPLSTAMLSKIISTTQSKVKGGFFWEIYKPPAGQASPTAVAQAVCKKLIPGASRCSGAFPSFQGYNETKPMASARRH